MMGSNFYFRDKIPIGVVGPNEKLGQQLIELLNKHPWFELKFIIDAHTQFEPLACSLIFSGYDDEAKAVELANQGFIVVTAAAGLSEQPNIPVILPEINSAHLGWLHQQPYKGGGIVVNPSLPASELGLSLKPLWEKFGIESICVSFDEDYSANQVNKLYDGTLASILADQSRHSLKHTSPRVKVITERKASEEGIREAWKQFTSEPQELMLPLAPPKPITFEHVDAESKHMGVTLGNLIKLSEKEWEYSIIPTQSQRGGGGGMIYIAELMVKKGFVYW